MHVAAPSQASSFRTDFMRILSTGVDAPKQ
jgi:hypothetical protein